MMEEDSKIKILGHIGVGGQKGYIYDTLGVISCLPASQWKDPCKIVVENPDRRMISNDRLKRG